MKIVIDGEIGAGKTTIINSLKDRLVQMNYKVVAIPEPVDLWVKTGILDNYYNAKGTAEEADVKYSFQTFTISTSIAEATSKVNENPDADIFLFDRSALTDRYIFLELVRDFLGSTRVYMYNTLWNLLTT